MALRDFIRRWMPSNFLNWYRNRKKKTVRKSIHKQRVDGSGFSQKDLENQLSEMGIVKGDCLLVHTSLSRMGFITGGPQAVVDALLNSVGEKGHVLMPTSPNDGLQLDYVKELDVFDVRFTPSKLGIISETFRQDYRALRSGSPTEPVSCIGPDCEYFTEGQIDQETPYDTKSPFYKVAKRKGKILYVGCTFDNAGTSLHLLEDAVKDFKFPVYYPELFDVQVRDAQGDLTVRKIKVHNPEMSARRKCDQLIPLFEEKGALHHTKLGNASVLLVDASTMLEIMIAAYTEKGVTMYTPHGS